MIECNDMVKNAFKTEKEIIKHRDSDFQFLVLSGIWMIACLIWTKNLNQALKWHSKALTHGYMYGNQSEGAEAYRKETEYPELK